MTSQYNQNWGRNWFAGPAQDQHMRVSDAERQAVADRLAEHFSSGRLDQAEFDDRVGRAMSAKTRADLNGLFDDLPETGAPAATDQRLASCTAGAATRSCSSRSSSSSPSRRRTWCGRCCGSAPRSPSSCSPRGPSATPVRASAADLTGDAGHQPRTGDSPVSLPRGQRVKGNSGPFAFARYRPGCAMSGGGGIAEPASLVFGGGGTAEQDASAVVGGGGMAEQDASAVFGGGGMAEQDASAIVGGGGITDRDNDVRGGGGMAEQDSVVTGGGGIFDPERAGFFAPPNPSCPASMPQFCPQPPLPTTPARSWVP